MDLESLQSTAVCVLKIFIHSLVCREHNSNSSKTSLQDGKEHELYPWIIGPCVWNRLGPILELESHVMLALQDARFGTNPFWVAAGKYQNQEFIPFLWKTRFLVHKLYWQQEFGPITIADPSPSSLLEYQIANHWDFTEYLNGRVTYLAQSLTHRKHLVSTCLWRVWDS